MWVCQIQELLEPPEAIQIIQTTPAMLDLVDLSTCHLRPRSVCPSDNPSAYLQSQNLSNPKTRLHGRNKKDFSSQGAYCKM